MDQRQWDMLSVAAERQRGRSRVRGTTAAVGLAGLTTAGVVAFTLPGPAHSTVTSKGTASSTSSPSPAGDEGQSAAPSSGAGDDSGSSSSSSGSSSSGSSSSNSVPANSVPTPAAAPPQATSGGS